MFEQTNPVYNDVSELWNDTETHGGRAGTVHLVQQMSDPGAEKIFLPRGSAETRFAPRQYYYLASKSGVVPTWVRPRM
jgi:hypothetical protein